jgi:hypothetical protein
MASANGFSWKQRKNGEIVIEHHSRRAAVLRGRRAADFLLAITNSDDQEVMARATGNYKRGNEREARNHPRNH